MNVVARAARIVAMLGVLALGALAGCGGGVPPARSADPLPLEAPADLAVIGQLRDPDELPALDLDFDPMPADAALVSSHYAIALVSVAVTDALNYDQLRGLNLHRQFPEAQAGPLRAGPGREFIVVPLTTPESTRTLFGGDSAEVIVDGEARPLIAVPHADEAIVVNVPAGGDAMLVITDASDVKSISLRTGGRESIEGRESAEGGAEGDHPADALQGADVQLEEGVAISGVSPAGQADGLRISVSIWPYGHLADRGRADEGRMWLDIEFSMSLASLVAERAELRLDLAGSLRIVGSDGTGVTLPAEPPIVPAVLPSGGLAVAEWSGAVQVPDTLREFEVSYTTAGTFTSPEGRELAFTRVPVTPTATLTLTAR